MRPSRLHDPRVAESRTRPTSPATPPDALPQRRRPQRQPGHEAPAPRGTRRRRYRRRRLALGHRRRHGAARSPRGRFAPASSPARRLPRHHRRRRWSPRRTTARRRRRRRCRVRRCSARAGRRARPNRAIRPWGESCRSLRHHRRGPYPAVASTSPNALCRPLPLPPPQSPPGPPRMFGSKAVGWPPGAPETSRLPAMVTGPRARSSSTALASERTVTPTGMWIQVK